MEVMQVKYTYRIADEKGLIDFAVDMETAKRKLEMYKPGLAEGYSKQLFLIKVNPETGREKIIEKI